MQNAAATFPCSLPQKGPCAPCFPGAHSGVNHLIHKRLVGDRRGDFPGRSEFLPALREDRGTERHQRNKVTKGMIIMFQVAR